MAAARARRQAWKVLVAVDGSRGSAAALRFTANLATCASGRVIVMTVAASPASRSPELVHANRLVDAATAMLGLVVVGSEGRDTLREWVVGGVALRLLYLSRRPVVVVRPPRRRNGSKQLAQSDHVSASFPVYAAAQVSRSKGSRRGGGS